MWLYISVYTIQLLFISDGTFCMFPLSSLILLPSIFNSNRPVLTWAVIQRIKPVQRRQLLRFVVFSKHDNLGFWDMKLYQKLDPKFKKAVVLFAHIELF